MFFRKTKPAPAPAPIKAAECKICGCDADYFGAVDFSQNCLRVPLPPAGVSAPYHRCANCGFLFTPLCDAWSQAEFEQKIYNDEYARIDPEFFSQRPLEQAQHFSGLLGAPAGTPRLLDYGGGGGRFAARMRELGYDAATFDPFHPGDFAPQAGERFALVHCREVLEHAADPQAFVADIIRHMSDAAVIYLSTVTQPPDIGEIRLGWWYAGPRNGHISLHTHQSLDLLWRDQGFEFGSFNSFLHLAWRGQPACLAGLLQNSGRLYRASEL